MTEPRSRGSYFLGADLVQVRPTGDELVFEISTKAGSAASGANRTSVSSIGETVPVAGTVLGDGPGGTESSELDDGPGGTGVTELQATVRSNADATAPRRNQPGRITIEG